MYLAICWDEPVYPYLATNKVGSISREVVNDPSQATRQAPYIRGWRYGRTLMAT